jgi:hypothetical protein
MRTRNRIRRTLAETDRLTMTELYNLVEMGEILPGTGRWQLRRS